MAGHAYQLRLIAPSALTSLLLLGLCTFVAIYLYNQQTDTATALGENIGSRRAAAELEVTLDHLINLHREGIEQVDGLHELIDTLIKDIKTFADKDEEVKQYERIKESFAKYRLQWRAALAASGTDREVAIRTALHTLEEETQTACRQLCAFNTEQIVQSEREHHQTLRRMAWGLAGVGGVGSLAGLLLGYGVARGLRRSIHQLRVHVRDAAGKLGQDLPPVVLTDEGGLDQLHAPMQDVARQVGEVVEQLQQREREVRRAEQLAAVGQLAAGVAHELRNPLTSIKMLVQAGREEAQARGLPAEDLQVIELEVRRMERCLKTFLEFARPPKLERRALDVLPVIEQTLNLVRGRADQQQVSVRFDRLPGPVVVEADGEQLQQVLVNLTLNALDAMPRGGTLAVGLRRAEGGAVEVRVCDTGPGIAPELMPRLFEPFVSGKETGLGLGLVVSQRIVEDHGGHLLARNRPEGGACFEFRLPALLK